MRNNTHSLSKRKKTTKGTKGKVSIVLLMMLFPFLSMNNVIEASKVPDSRPITNEEYANKETLQPYGNTLQVDELKHWSPDKDPDARYNRASIPLKERYMGPLVNPNASPDAKVMSLAMTNPRASTGKSQGGEGVNVYAFTNFQYVDSYNYWGGSSHEGIIAIPTPEHINSAHKNGVKATGTIFFPWGDKEFVEEAMTQFTEQDEDGNYIIADKLFEIADYYGFEGFFINQESSIDPELAAKFKDVLVYIQNNKPDNFVMQWYDSMLPNGSIDYQNGVTENNIGMIQNKDQKINDEVFLNFNWNKDRIDNSIQTMKKAGRSPYDIFASWEYFPETKHTGKAEHLYGDNKKVRTSIGLLSPTVTLTNSDGPEDFQNVEDPKFWVGPTFNPADTSTRDEKEFPGISSLVADKTPILGTNFVTHFTTGNGYKFYEEGNVTKDEEWHNRSLTDVMPTWRWIVESEGSKLSPEIDYEDAYRGGTSLKIHGKLEANHSNHIKLYSSKLDVNQDSKLSITYKSKASDNKMQIGLDFKGTYEEKDFTFFEVKNGEENEWNTVEIDLSKYKGRVIKAISLKFDTEKDIDNLSVNIGRLAITDNTIAPSEIRKATFDEIMFEDYAHAEARIYWDRTRNATLYTIHRVMEDGTKKFIGATPNNAFYIPPFEKDGKEDNFDFEITPISETGVKGPVKELQFDWTIPTNTAEFVDRKNRENVALNQPVVSNVDVENDGPVNKINDGVITLSKWATKGTSSKSDPHTATIDLGEEKEISRWVVHHANAPGAGESPLMNTVDFKLRYAKDDGLPLLNGDTSESKERVSKMEFLNADSVTDNRLDVTDRNLSEPIKARYIQLYVTNSDRSQWKATRVYEFEAYKEKFNPRTEPINMQFVKAKNNKDADDVVLVSEVTEGDKVNLYSDIDSKEVLASKVAPESGLVKFTKLDFGADRGRIYYTVKNKNYLESVKRSVPYGAETGEKIEVPQKEDISLKRSLKGNQPSYANKYGVLTLKDLPDGVRAELYTSEDQLFPDLLSAPARNGVIVQERIPLEEKNGEIYIELVKEGVNNSDRFTVTYETDKLSGDVTGLKDIIFEYGKLKQEDYTLKSWEDFNTAMKEGKEILAKDTPTVEEILRIQDEIESKASDLKERETFINSEIDNLDDELEMAYEKGHITNHGIFNSLLNKATKIQQVSDNKVEVINRLKALGNQVRAQSGKKVDEVFAEGYLSLIEDLKNEIKR
ncbi:endo-beta-N-acetylglucosaminidase [Virgibacillus halodenitrificans]|uniref:endo-beta-N-acetylglucosaminidase n=1 Tax=Virgibacillus halodenitrificans TaxID=1482 RepID=UPI000EF545D0|nr:discoidin domain-containing protein [Virgibacillus halodenitrificans]